MAQLYVLLGLFGSCASSYEQTKIKTETFKLNFMLKAEKREDGSQLADYKSVEGTPFTIAIMEMENVDEHQYFVLMGKYRFNEQPFSNEEDARIYANTINWDMIMRVLSVFMEEYKPEKLKEHE